MTLYNAIKEFYPEYLGIQNYPIDNVAKIHKINEEYGILSNFAHTPIKINNLTFDTSERLYQMLKMNNVETQKLVYEKKGNPKMFVKHLEKINNNVIRNDWGKIFIDVMKFCLNLKYQQNEMFRNKLQECKNLYIIEDQTTFPRKTANTWGVKLINNEYIGPNLLGRLLMELRDGNLKYEIPNNLILLK